MGCLRTTVVLAALVASCGGKPQAPASAPPPPPPPDPAHPVAPVARQYAGPACDPVIGEGDCGGRCGVFANGCGGTTDCGVCEVCPAKPQERQALLTSAAGRRGFVDGTIRARGGKSVPGAVMVFPGERWVRAGADGSFHVGPLGHSDGPVRVSAPGLLTRYERLVIYPCRQRIAIELDRDPDATAHPERGIVKGIIKTPRPKMPVSVELRVWPQRTDLFPEQFRVVTENGTFQLAGVPTDWYRLPARFELYVTGPYLGEHSQPVTPDQAGHDFVVDRSTVPMPSDGR